MGLFSIFNAILPEEQPGLTPTIDCVLPDFLKEEIGGEEIQSERQVQLLGAVYDIMKRCPTTSRVDDYLIWVGENSQKAPWQGVAEKRFVTQALNKHAGRGLRPLAEEVAERLQAMTDQSLMMHQDNNTNDIIGTCPFMYDYTPIFPFGNADESLVPVITGQNKWSQGFVYGLAEREELCGIAQEIVRLCYAMVKKENKAHLNEKIDLEDALVDLMADKEREIVNDKIPGFRKFTQEKELFCWLSATTYVRHLEVHSPKMVQEAGWSKIAAAAKQELTKE